MFTYSLTEVILSGKQIARRHGHGRPQTFFQGRAKIFQGGQEPTFCLKNNKKTKQQKSLKTYYFWPARGGKSPPLPSPADAHGHGH